MTKFKLGRSRKVVQGCQGIGNLNKVDPDRLKKVVKELIFQLIEKLLQLF
jgi:hypothetical protein